MKKEVSDLQEKNINLEEENYREREENERLKQAYQLVLETSVERDCVYAQKVEIEKDLKKEKSGSETI